MITKYYKFIKETRTNSEPEEYGITNYKWVNGKLDVYDTVVLSKNEITNNRLPFNFGKIEGDFFCLECDLTSLDGSPEIVNGNFYCKSNKLETLSGGPLIVTGNYICSNNKLTSLIGSPERINGDFFCSNNNLISLEYCPKIINKIIYCKSNNFKLSVDIYPPSYIGSYIMPIDDKCDKITDLVRFNNDLFMNILGNKIAFHQMVMRLMPDLISYYKTIPPPSKKSILYHI